MADPLKFTCTANTWVKVADAVSYGNIRVTNTTPFYLVTYREAGGTAPTATEGAQLVGPRAKISHDVPIDVYVYAKDAEGEVEVWL
jgi:hypothetical protein